MELSVKRIKELDELLAVFPFALLQDFVTFGKHCKKNEIEVDEVIAYIHNRVATMDDTLKRMRRLPVDEIAAKSPRCQTCNRIMRLESVNDRESRMVDDHSNSWWICPDMLCDGEPILSDKFVYEILSDMGIPIKEPKTLKQPVSPRRARLATQQRDQGRGQNRRG